MNPKAIADSAYEKAVATIIKAAPDMRRDLAETIVDAVSDLMITTMHLELQAAKEEDTYERRAH
jgi:hypothetical protein